MAEKKDSKPTWMSTQSEISKAIQEWSNVTEEIKVESKVTPKIAPDQHLLKDIEGLIKQIKTKLDEFSPPTATEVDEAVKNSMSSIENQEMAKDSNPSPEVTNS
jgi:hypothetical protein